MNSIRLVTLLALIVLCMGCANQTDYSRLGDSGAAQEHRLLVTFVDRSINRDLPGNSQDAYLVRGSYGNSSWSERIAQKLAERYRLQLIAQWPVTELGVNCVVYEVPESLVVNQVIETLRKDNDVGSVQLMQSFRVLAEQADKQAIYSDPYLPLQSAFNLLSIGEWHKKTTGHGVRIALIDTGVDLNHPDLKGQINYTENMAPEPGDHNLADKHGTAVAGVLSAKPNNGIGIAGIAPEAEVMAFRACWPDQPNSLAARCNSFTLALALNQAMRMNSQIINLSLSGPEDPLLKMLIDKALSKGIIVIAAVPGKNQPGGFPADIPGVLAVGQGGETGSNEIVAPGQDILTTVPHEAYDFMSGSSFATPHVAGMAALLLQLRPNWQVADIKQQLHHPETMLGVLQNAPGH
jgi:subtilisin family serine protease